MASCVTGTFARVAVRREAREAGGRAPHRGVVHAAEAEREARTVVVVVERPARLGAAMAASFYDLQYLVYTVALHRMLAGRLRDYDYDRHFGGVYYLFARGMHPAQGPAAGVYFARPERALVEALDACLAPEHGLILREAVA